jgi:NlpC/P60 family
MVWTDGIQLWREAQRLLRAGGRVCVLHVLVFGAMAQCGRAAAGQPQESGSAARLVTAEQGRQIAAAALEQDEPVRGTQDCSHLVHQIYSTAGYEYAYASSFDLYAGNANFRRVRHPQAGDLITWPGHVGIVIDPRRHSFHSLVRSGLQTEDYLGSYWRSRGRPRFYRYVVDGGSDVETAKATRQAQRTGSASLRKGRSANAEIRTQAENANAQDTQEEASLRSKVIAAPRFPTSDAVTAPIGSSVLITPEQRRPTADEALDRISELTDAAADALRTAEPLQVTLPIVIFDELRVERVETKRDHGWVHLQIESHVRIAEEGVDFKRRREKVRWELRRDASGWTAIAPAERTFVARDGAVRVLSAQLAEMAGSDAAAKHDESLVGKEARIVNLLGALLEKKQQ